MAAQPPLIKDATRAQRPAAEVAKPIRLSPRARKLLTADCPSGAYLATLIRDGLYYDAIRFLAHAIPNREAVWWLCLCAWHSTRDGMSKPEEAALRSALHWVLQPTPDTRKAAGAASLVSGMKNPCGCAAKGAQFGRSDVAGADAGRVQPILAAKAVAGGLLIAASRLKTGKMAERLNQFLALGIEVATGANRWDEKDGAKAPR